MDEADRATTSHVHSRTDRHRLSFDRTTLIEDEEGVWLRVPP